MASLNLQSPQSLSLSSRSSLSPQIQSSSLSFRFPSSKNKPLCSIKSSSTEALHGGGGFSSTIALTENALKQLNAMRFEKNENLCVRIDVKRGGCSGTSYTMKFEEKQSSGPSDCAIEYEGFVIICDHESLANLRGMQLDYVDTLVGGGFSFKNTNATPRACNCAKSLCCRSVIVSMLIHCTTKNITCYFVSRS